jgi:hypothetical protein
MDDSEIISVKEIRLSWKVKGVVQFVELMKANRAQLYLVKEKEQRSMLTMLFLLHGMPFPSSKNLLFCYAHGAILVAHHIL